jgi:hypothetical protein
MSDEELWQVFLNSTGVDDALRKVWRASREQALGEAAVVARSMGFDNDANLYIAAAIEALKDKACS